MLGKDIFKKGVTWRCMAIYATKKNTYPFSFRSTIKYFKIKQIGGGDLGHLPYKCNLKSDLKFDLLTINPALKPEVRLSEIENFFTFKSAGDIVSSAKKTLPITLPGIA